MIAEKTLIPKLCTVDMIFNEINLYLADRRELYVFAAIAGGWLKNREPPAVQDTYDMLRDCGVLASRDVLGKIIKRLIGVKWLADRPRGEKQSRYVPTLRGFVGFAMAVGLNNHELFRNKEVVEPLSLECLSKRVDVSSVIRLGIILNTLLAVGTLLYLYRLPMLGLPPDSQTKLVELVRATMEGRPIDVVPQALEVLQMAPALECNFEYYLYYFATLLALNLEIDGACRSGAGSELEDIIRSAVKVLSRLSQYCATRKGIDGFNKVLEDIEKRLNDDKPFVQCNNTQSQGKQKLSEFLP